MHTILLHLRKEKKGHSVQQASVVLIALEQVWLVNMRSLMWYLPYSFQAEKKKRKKKKDKVDKE